MLFLRFTHENTFNGVFPCYLKENHVFSCLNYASGSFRKIHRTFSRLLLVFERKSKLINSLLHMVKYDMRQESREAVSLQ